jgi:hypothetical protein
VSLTTNGHNFGVLASGTKSPTYGTELSQTYRAPATLARGGWKALDFRAGAENWMVDRARRIFGTVSSKKLPARPISRWEE